MQSSIALKIFSEKHHNRYKLYPHSLKHWENNSLFIIKDVNNKYLAIVGDYAFTQKFEGKSLKKLTIKEDELEVRIANLTHHNLDVLRKIFPFLSPSVSGAKASFGAGDRLGIVTPAHIHAFENSGLFPVLARESVREITRTERTWESVLEDTIWGCFETGYEGPFGADADHVKEIPDIQKAIDAGYTMFTIDPSDQVPENPQCLNKKELTELYNAVPDRKKLENLYLGKSYTINGEKLHFTQEKLVKVAVLYSKALNHVVKCFQYIKEHSKKKFELEVSVDETQSSTDPVSHIFITEELHRMGVDFQNLALHYVGTFQKAVDYIGDVGEFTKDMKRHASIAGMLGGYKLSLHSGGLKFSVYPVFSKLTGGLFHVKISTGWLESMRIVMRHNPGLYRKIHPYILKTFIRDRASYDLNTDLSLIPDINTVSDSDLEGLLGQDEARQLIHTAYGSILSAKDEKGKYFFRNSVYQTLFSNEDEHYQAGYSHLKKHLDLLQT